MWLMFYLWYLYLFTLDTGVQHDIHTTWSSCRFTITNTTVPLVNQELLTIHVPLVNQELLTIQVALVNQELLTIQLPLVNQELLTIQVPRVNQELLTIQEHLNSPSIVVGSCCTMFNLLCIVLGSLLVPFPLIVVMSVIWYAASDCLWELHTFLIAEFEAKDRACSVSVFV